MESAVIPRIAGVLSRGKWAFGCVIAVGSLLAAPAEAITITYDAVVDETGGPLADAFPAGAAVEVSYTLDPDAEDQDSDPNRGEFPGAVQSISVALPELGILISGSGGEAWTFDDNEFEPTQTSYDRALFFGHSISATGLPLDESISFIELEFSSEVALPSQPAMLDSDALPTVELPVTNATIRIVADGPSYIRLVPRASNALVRVKYRAVVDRAIGPLADAFPDGAAVDISYTLDRRAADSYFEPSRAVYRGAVQALSVSLSEVDVSVTTGPVGSVSVFDNVLDEGNGTVSDQIFVDGGQIISANFAGGETVSEVELEFLSDNLVPPEEPRIIDSDTLPTSMLPLTSASVWLRTAGEPTFFYISDARSSSGSGDDGCAIGRGDPGGAGIAWLGFLPALVLALSRQIHSRE